MDLKNTSLMMNLEACYILDGEQAQWPKGYECTGWRLPSEAEWEAAVSGQNMLKVETIAWISTNSLGKTWPVASKQPDARGLYDMFGNVREWVWDGYEYYANKDVKDPIVEASVRVGRGGFFGSDLQGIRPSSRIGNAPTSQENHFGFRLARTLGK